MTLTEQLILGGLMIALTVAIQGILLDIIIHKARHASSFLSNRIYAWKPVLSSLIVVAVFGIHIIQIWLWALLYLWLDAIPLHSFDDALYFSTSTFSTAGYGDIVLSSSTRMLSAIEAANGFLAFGWTTAFIFEVISKLYKSEAKSL